MPEEGHQALIIDGHNNPGFSGGPVVFTKPGSNDYKVAGVISGYKVQYEPVLLEKEGTGLEYAYNTGLVIAYQLYNGVEHLTQNPTGGRGKGMPVTTNSESTVEQACLAWLYGRGWRGMLAPN